MRIQHNIAALNSYRQMGGNNNALSKNLEKLSSGYRINRAGDDAAGLAISEKMRSQIKGLETAQKNANDGISLVQTAEGALTEVHSMLNRMTELATQSANGTYENKVDRPNLQKEVEALLDEINRISESTNFNGINLLDGSLGGGAVSADGATFTGKEIAKYTEATQTVNLDNWTTATATKDTFIVDGQSLVIDWSKGEAKKVLSSLTAADLSSAGTELTKDIAKKLETLFNDQMKEQGLTGSVAVKYSADGTIKIESTNKGATSEVSFAGTDGDVSANESIGALMFGSTAGESVINEATKEYNGDTITATDKFLVEINGVKIEMKGIAATKGTTTMGNLASSVQTALQNAVTSYNSMMGLTAGQKDTDTGLTGLKTSDFEVNEKDGKLEIKYTGDEDVAFSFSDIGDDTFAKTLGLDSGSSKSGGANGLTLQIGDTADSFNQLSVRVDSMSANALGVANVDISTLEGAQDAIGKIKDAINKVSSTRGDLGAVQNRLEHTINNLGVTTENITAAESRIRDTDMASEMMAYTKNNILIQASQAMLAQANQVPQGVLQLLQ